MGPAPVFPHFSIPLTTACRSKSSQSIARWWELGRWPPSDRPCLIYGRSTSAPDARLTPQHGSGCMPCHRSRFCRFPAAAGDDHRFDRFQNIWTFFHCCCCPVLFRFGIQEQELHAVSRAIGSPGQCRDPLICLNEFLSVTIHQILADDGFASTPFVRSQPSHTLYVTPIPIQPVNSCETGSPRYFPLI